MQSAPIQLIGNLVNYRTAPVPVSWSGTRGGRQGWRKEKEGKGWEGLFSRTNFERVAPLMIAMPCERALKVEEKLSSIMHSLTRKNKSDTGSPGWTCAAKPSAGNNLSLYSVHSYKYFIFYLFIILFIKIQPDKNIHTVNSVKQAENGLDEWPTQG